MQLPLQKYCNGCQTSSLLIYLIVFLKLTIKGTWEDVKCLLYGRKELKKKSRRIRGKRAMPHSITCHKLLAFINLEKYACHYLFFTPSLLSLI